LESKGLEPDVHVDAFAGEEIVAGSSGTAGGSGAGTGSGVTIVSGPHGQTGDEDDDDPQLAAAVKLARQAVRSGNK